MTRVAAVAAVAVVLSALSTTSFAQDSKSGPLAKQLAAALDGAKLDSIAAPDPSDPGTFVAALYFANMQLLVVSAKYTAPLLLSAKVEKKDYRDVYIDLNSASVPESKTFIEDLGADGLKAKRDENQPFDTFEHAGKRTVFDSDWKKQKLSEQDYMKAFSGADDEYSKILTALLAQLKKTS
jgi:type II secretory pathway pseudopilin PulG